MTTTKDIHAPEYIADIKARFNIAPDYNPGAIKLVGGAGDGGEGTCCVRQESRRIRGLDSRVYSHVAGDSRVLDELLMQRPRKRRAGRGSPDCSTS